MRTMGPVTQIARIPVACSRWDSTGGMDTVTLRATRALDRQKARRNRLLGSLRRWRSLWASTAQQRMATVANCTVRMVSSGL
jgi:hypothetical protein